MAESKSTPSVSQFSSAVQGSSYSQRTFLGSSVSKFTLNAGFGSTVSSLGVNLIDDQINKGDLTGKGAGQDPYHNTVDGDRFTPPPVGSPVFFSSGPAYPNDTSKPLPTTEDSFRKTMDDLYDTNTTDDQKIGYYDLAFGGLLQTYNQTRSATGNPVYTVKVVDPREILSNVELILRNFAGSTMNNMNMFNLYGFLEFNGVAIDLEDYNEDLLTREVDDKGKTKYDGTDMRYTGSPQSYEESLQWSGANSGQPTKFPITGTGMSRIGPQGIPYYRVVQALNALGGLYGPIPAEYADAGFGGYINFRGFNYVIDLSAVPIINQFYYFDYDKISLLDFCEEVCEITSSELFVSLLPIIDHPATKHIFEYNEEQDGDASKMVHGVIKVSTINRTQAQEPNAIKKYIDENMYGQASRTDIGVELSNVVTDKFIAGGQEVQNVLFDTTGDRLEEDSWRQWTLKYAYSQQLLPYYGKLRSGAVTIPKGFGAYQQILLDATDLNLRGVGDYYIATEMELRAAAVSYESWAAFLIDYNELYMESTEDNDRVEGASLDAKPNVDGLEGVKLSKNYAVTVPRCLWANPSNEFGDNGLPVDVCHPPYGYPLYYKRAAGIGLADGGMASLGSSFLGITTSIASISNATDQKDFITILRSEWQELKDASKDWNQHTTTAEKEYFKVLENVVEQVLEDPVGVLKSDVIGLLQEFGSKLNRPQKVISKAGQKGVVNAQRVYKFLKDIANKYLGKKYLVRIPQAVNWEWSTNVAEEERDGKDVVIGGPFGFKPRSVNNDPRVVPEKEDAGDILNLRKDGTRVQFADAGRRHLQVVSTAQVAAGALVTNENPVTGERISNYATNNSGGYWDSALTAIKDGETKSPLEKQGLAPVDRSLLFKSNGRVGCYVKFDNSQKISFDRISRDKFVQQTADGSTWITDINYNLDNVANGSTLNMTPEDPEDAGQPSIAFVKADVEAKILFAPKMTTMDQTVYGQFTKDIARWSKPKRIFNCETNKIETSIPWLISDLRPTSEKGETVSVEIVYDGTDTEKKENSFYLDTDHAYAVISLPNRLEPTVDSRLQDGPGQAFNTWRVKHACNQDVVRGVAGFDKPGFRDKSTNIVDEQNLRPLPLTARRAIARAKDAATYGKAELAFVSPSPVYPQLVCIPLESSERCYGPWSSSLTNGSFQNIGGDIEYEKDDNLAPWNFSGYDLMNQAADVKIQYSNSLLLQSERGSFSIPSAPNGIALASYLGNFGPLVTSINVSIGINGVETSYVMDMYTASFGKLQKQKSDNIAKMGRLKQQQTDQKNLALRRDMRKSQMDDSRQETEDMIRNFSVEDAGVELSPGFTVQSGGVTNTVLTVQERDEAVALIPDDVDDTNNTVDSVYRSYTTTGSTTNGSNAGETASLMPPKNQARDFSNSADSDIQDQQIVSSTPRGTSMSGTGNKAQSMDDLYDDDIVPTSSWG